MSTLIDGSFMSYSLPYTYGGLVAHAVALHGDKVAFVTAERSYTYSELGNLISQFGLALSSVGLVKGDAVAMLSPNRLEYFAANIACALMGVRYTPLHPLGSVADHSYILDDADIKALLVDPVKFGARALELRAACSGLSSIFSFGPMDGALDIVELASGFKPKPLEENVDAGDILAVAYTGGTTGKPKGAILTHGGIAKSAMVASSEWDWPDDVTILLATPISHAAGAMIIPTLLKGGKVILRGGFNVDELLIDIETYKVTTLFLVPTMIYMLLDKLKETKTDVSSLGLVIYGAAPMSPSRLKEARSLIGPVFMQIYGQVESSTTITALKQKDHDDPSRLSSCGKPLEGNIVKLLDDNCDEVGVGEIGEICIKGLTLMDGYWKKPAETDEVFRGGWLHTGDMARRDEEGFLYIVDRSKDMIISGGFNVYPREIEDVLMTQEGIKLAAVIGVPDPKWGEAVTAIVVRSDDMGPTEQDIIDLVKTEKGAAYAPKTVHFVDAMPLTALGKVDKKAVRSEFWQGQDRQVG